MGIAVSEFNSFYGIPGKDAQDERPRIDLSQDKVQAKGEWRVHDYDLEAMRFWFGSSDYAHNEIDFNQAENKDEIGSRFTNNESEARFEVEHTPVILALGKLSGAVGTQWTDRDTRGQSFDGNSLLDPANRSSIAGYWFEQLEISPRTSFQAAVRAEHTEVDGADRLDPPHPADDVVSIKRSYAPVSASLGMLYKLPENVVFSLNGQYAQRAPEAQELFSKGAHDATATFELGNPDLQKETAKTVEVGLRRAKGDFRFDATAYYTKFDGFIFKQLTGLTCGGTLESCGLNNGEDLDQVLISQRDATFYGSEIAAQYDVAPIWHGVWGVDSQFDFVRAQFENGDNVPRIPPYRLGGGIYYRDANWFARVGILHAFDHDQVNREENEETTPGYNLVSAEISYTNKLPDTSTVGTEYTIGIKGSNLADDAVLNSSSFKRREDVLEPGANVKAFAKIKFN